MKTLLLIAVLSGSLVACGTEKQNNRTKPTPEQKVAQPEAEPKPENPKPEPTVVTPAVNTPVTTADPAVNSAVEAKKVGLLTYLISNRVAISDGLKTQMKAFYELVNQHAAASTEQTDGAQSAEQLAEAEEQLIEATENELDQSEQPTISIKDVTAKIRDIGYYMTVKLPAYNQCMEEVGDLSYCKALYLN